MESSVPDVPVFFLKPDTAILRENRPLFYPDFTNRLEYETELVLRISRLGRSISPKFASRYFTEIGIGLDMTARDLQKAHRSKGLPWEVAKSFDNAAPLSREFIPVSEISDLKNIEFGLDINGTTVQHGNSADMIFGFDEIISYVSKFITLKIGDLIFTGTPPGVGPVHVGDKLRAYIGNKTLLELEVK
jgi:2-keto-4-pentenoate hydratase/2-oxohepta-3-ene-1,7-dioic acid hydratase in catechol pathway